MSVTRGLGRAKRNAHGSPYNYVQCKMMNCGNWFMAKEGFIKPDTKRTIICPECAGRLYGPKEQTI